jgi:hypothetical protein
LKSNNAQVYPLIPIAKLSNSRRKKEEGRRKREEGRRKKEEGKKEDAILFLLLYHNAQETRNPVSRQKPGFLVKPYTSHKKIIKSLSIALILRYNTKQIKSRKILTILCKQ